MAWPKNMAEVSTNLPEEEFTLIKFAIDHELVEWQEGGLLASLRSCPFKFNGYLYELTEVFEVVSSINRKESELNESKIYV